jgi:hypothetical protein
MLRLKPRYPTPRNDGAMGIFVPGLISLPLYIWLRIEFLAKSGRMMYLPVLNQLFQTRTAFRYTSNQPGHRNQGGTARLTVRYTYG